MLRSIGPRSRRVYEALRERIDSGSLGPGDRLPGQVELAEQFGVALMTVREALAQLSADGLIAIEHGRGTFVRAQCPPSVLVVDDDPSMRELLADIVRGCGFHASSAAGPAAALRMLEDDASIAMVLSDVRMPSVEHGIRFIAAARRRWPNLPLAAVTAYPGDLGALSEEPECPVLVVHKPFRIRQIAEVLALTLGTKPDPRSRGGEASRTARPAALVASPASTGARR